MKARDFLKIEQNHGTGKKENLTKHQVESLQRVCDKFRKALLESCDDYLMYRCTLTSDDNMIYATVICTDLDGEFVQCQIGYDYENFEVYTRKINIKNEGKVCYELYDLVVKLVELVPFTVGMLDFPMEGAFKEGFRMGYNKESGTYLIIIKDSLNKSMFMRG